VNGNLSLWANDLTLTVGHHGKGALNIIDGGNVNSMYGEIGSSHGSGVVTVDGAYSTWHIFDDLFIGKVGSGVLDIAGGGGVINYGPGFIGFDSGSTGVVTVNGSDSSWHNGGDLKIGGVGKGTLNITSGGRVSATNVLLISSQSLLAIDVGNGSSVTVGGTGWIDNSGTVRISATANAAAGVYTPIIAGSWSGSGTYQALGGTWNTSTHQFTVSTAQSGASGETVVMALSAGPRVVFDDAGETGWSVGASFAPTGGSGTLSFAATTISGSELTSLETLTGENQSVLGGWEFTAGEGYTQGSRVYLTFDVGEGFSANGLQVWHSHDGSWSPYAVSDLTYDGRYASFTVTGFSGYAVTTVPEPSTLALLAFGSLGLIAYAWRRRRRWEQIGADRKTCSPAD
jgi:T5SS/PEP-CTERM-associated repeat protein